MFQKKTQKGNFDKKNPNIKIEIGPQFLQITPPVYIIFNLAPR